MSLRRNILMLMSIALSLAGCASGVQNRNPVGEQFPAVSGESLAGKAYELPADLEGKPAVLLVGYVMKAQFDLDRWLLGITQAGLPVQVYEVPAAKGLLATAAAPMIDEGMRSGIPREDWRSVVTVYKDAGRIVRATGNENPRNARVLLLDKTGRIVWFHDSGYSAGKMLELKGVAEGLLND